MGIFDRFRAGQNVSPFGSSSGGGGGGANTTLSNLTGFTAGSISFFSSSAALSQDNANLFWDNTNKSLLVGTTSQPSGVTGTPLSLVSSNATSANGFQYIEYVQANANGSGIAIRKARGTTGTRTNVLSADNLGNITFNGYTAAGYGAGTSAIGSSATEDFSNTTTANRGSNLFFQTTPTGASGTRRTSMTLNPASLRLHQTDGTNGIIMTVPTSNYTMSLPAALPGAGSGAFWTIGSGGSGNFSVLSGDCTSGASQGQINVVKIQGTAVSVTAPTQSQFLSYSVGPLAWVPTTFAGDLTPTGAVGVITVAKIQTVPVSATTPTDGQVLAYDLGTLQWKPTTISGGGGAPTKTILTSGSGTYTTPVGATLLKVTLVGGGGGGGAVPATTGADSSAAAGGGGGGGVIAWIASPAATYSYGVGALGAGRAVFGAPYKGADGGNSTFSSYTATGGIGGSSCGNGGATFVFGDPAGAGGSGTGGDLNVGGNGGFNGIAPGGTGAYFAGGNGGSSAFGLGGGGVGPGEHSLSNNGGAATGYGGGGAGAGSSGTSPLPGAGAGGDATAGVIIIEEFY